MRTRPSDAHGFRLFDGSSGFDEVSEGCGEQVDDGCEGCDVSVAASVSSDIRNWTLCDTQNWTPIGQAPSPELPGATADCWSSPERRFSRSR